MRPPDEEATRVRFEGLNLRLEVLPGTLVYLPAAQVSEIEGRIVYSRFKKPHSLKMTMGYPLTAVRTVRDFFHDNLGKVVSFFHGDYLQMTVKGTLTGISFQTHYPLFDEPETVTMLIDVIEVITGEDKKGLA